MMLTPEDSKLVRQTFASVSEESDCLVRDFFCALIDLDPSLASVFTSQSANYDTFKIRLLEFLRLSVDAVQDETLFACSLPLLTRLYLALGVRGEHYVTFGSALMCSLEKRLGSAFSGDVQAAWTTVYLLLAEIARDEPDPHLFADGSHN